TAKTKTPKGKTGNRNKKKQTNSKVSKKQEQTTSANEISETSTEETGVERVPLDEIKKKKQELLNEKNNSILEPVVKEEKANEEKNNVAVSQDLESGASVQKVPLAEIKKVQEENGLTETTVQQNKEKDIVSNVQKEKKGMDFSPKFHSLREGVTFILDAYTQDYKLGDGDIEAYKADMKEMLEYGITQTELKNFEEVSEFDIDETIENYLKAKQIGKNSDNLEMGEDS
ncbi:MAG: hypothetical protein IJD48_03135, partial [Clostridia bacterium]|nr:hypothetical protein [Clostridia bacterium]